MRCGYHEAGLCGSCTLLHLPYAAQVAAAQDRVAGLLAHHRDLAWLEPFAGPEARFRNKAKMVVTGTVERPVVGILGEGRTGVDLRGCALHEPAVRDALGVLPGFLTRARVPPYDLATRRGEVKHLLVTGSPDAELMVRLVLRTDEAVPRVRKHLPWLLERLPRTRVVSANLQPAHKAVLEGEREVPLTDQQELAVRLDLGDRELGLRLRPQGFFQTDTAVAAALYRQVRDWVDERSPRTVWDLYCGVGGFALACAAPGRDVLGLELSDQAVAAARSAAAAAQAAGTPGAGGVRFAVGDATTYLREEPAPDLVVVNPPRRGIGELAGWLEASGVRHVVYSSCNPDSLVRDLAAMPSLRPVRGRLLDMFPHTTHVEVALLLQRRG